MEAKLSFVLSLLPHSSSSFAPPLSKILFPFIFQKSLNIKPFQTGECPYLPCHDQFLQVLTGC
jgi:hypothetical protein